MPVISEIISYAYLIGAAQGILFSLGLFARRDKSLSIKILALWLFCASLQLIFVFLYEKEAYLHAPHVIGITRSFPFLYGPFFYLYTKSLTRGITALDGKQYLHFLPFALFSLYLAVFLLAQSGEYKIAFHLGQTSGHLSSVVTAANWAYVIHGFIYVFLTLGLLREHRQKIGAYFSNTDRIRLNWLRTLAFWQILTWVIVFVVIYLALGRGVQFAFTPNAPIFLSIAVQLCFMGYFGQRQPAFFNDYRITEGATPETVESEENNAALKYDRSGLQDTQAEEIIYHLSVLMDREKLYLDSDLTLPQLAQHLQVSRHNLSEAINSRLGLNFYDCVNQYRVEEVKRLITHPDYSNYTLLALAEEAGFKTKSTFNAMFKKFTGMTPSAYRKSIAQKTAA